MWDLLDPWKRVCVCVCIYVNMYIYVYIFQYIIWKYINEFIELTNPVSSLLLHSYFVRTNIKQPQNKVIIFMRMVKEINMDFHFTKKDNLFWK